MRITHALRCTAILATSAAGVAFWGTNLFFSQAEYDAYRADSRVLAADKARAVLAAQAVLQSLGFSNAASTSNPPPTVTGKDGTLQYAPHNIVKASANFGDASWNQNGTASTAGAGATVAGWGTSRFTGNANTAGYYCTFAYQPANGVAFVIAHYVSRVSGAGVFVGGTDAFGTQLKFDPVGGTFSGGPSNKGAVAVAGGWLIWGQYAGNGSPMGAICYGNGTFDVATWAMRGSALLDYVPTTSAAAFGLPITYDRGATWNGLRNSGDTTQTGWTIDSPATGAAGAARSNGVVMSLVSVAGSNGIYQTWTPPGPVAATRTEPALWLERVSTSGTLRLAQPVGGDATGLWLIDLAKVPDGPQWITRAHPAVTISAEFQSRSSDNSTGVWLKSSGPTLQAYVAFAQVSGSLPPPAYLKTGATAPLYTQGTPRNQNLVPNSTDLSGWTAGSCTVSAQSTTLPNGATGNCYRVTATGSNADFYIQPAAPTGCVYTNGIWIRRVSGSGTVQTITPGNGRTTQTISASWQQFTDTAAAAGGNIFIGARIVTNGDVIEVALPQSNEGSVLLAYYGTSGSAYSEYPQYAEARFGAATRETLHPRDLTQAAWTKSGSMTAAKTATDEGGVANACSTLTSAGTNQTCLQSVTSASANRAFAAKIRARSASSLTIDLTCDGGTTWQAVTVNAAWMRWPITQNTVTNPSYGFRLRANGDAIDVDQAQGEQGTFSTPFVWGTESAAQTRDATLIRPPTSYINDTAQTTLIGCVPAGTGTVADGYLLARNAGFGLVSYFNSGYLKIFDGVNDATVNTVTVTAGIPHKAATRYSSGGLGASIDGSALITSSFDGSMGNSGATVGLGDDGAGGSGFSGYITRLAIRGTAANDAEMQLAGTGGR